MYTSQCNTKTHIDALGSGLLLVVIVRALIIAKVVPNAVSVFLSRLPVHLEHQLPDTASWEGNGWENIWPGQSEQMFWEKKWMSSMYLETIKHFYQINKGEKLFVCLFVCLFVFVSSCGVTAGSFMFLTERLCL